MKISVVIPSYNGKHLLKKVLPVVLKYSGDAEIVVVDDGSKDGTLDYLRVAFPSVRAIKNDVNLGFPQSVNIGIRQAKGDLVALLNNDVFVTKDYLKSSQKYFRDPNIYGVNFNEASSSWPRVSWHRGKFCFSQGEDKTAAYYVAWASGGSSLIRRDLFIKLGGFNRIYSPGYWEDIDLGWRAWSSGYKIIWDPDSKVIHRHESTFSKLEQKPLVLIKQRNELLFTWQNITKSSYMFEHLLYLAGYSALHPGYIKVILKAIQKLPKLKANLNPKVTNSNVFKYLNQRV